MINSNNTALPFECIEAPAFNQTPIIYYPITKLCFDEDRNFIGTGKLICDDEGARIEITNYGNQEKN